ncbi:hypothetical protein AJ80_07348 [Polytolypa hystricis UAMH7299]|uniref:DM2 domain-containing protein n=1 Tax=Polytolypa hystricis (strain UAMH7299) TaxID=1447883 RepID=A0A2B7XPN4_POLH7|nr:hypothetical protein AJ80_07348 [Polytolypa hystricis UAMH7299]
MNAPMQASYRGYPPQATAHRAPTQHTPRRAGPAPGSMMPVPLAQQGVPNPQLHAQQRNVANSQEAALRRSRKPTEKNLPDGVEEIVYGDAVQQYKKLREVEKKLDAAMIRKRLDIQDSVNRTVRRFRTLRIWISNTVENQPWQQQQQQGAGQDGGAALGGAGRYKVKIEGRLLDDNEDPTIPEPGEDEDEGEQADTQERDPDAMEEDSPHKKDDNANSNKKSSRRPNRNRLSNFFKSITVEFEKPALQGVADLATINWTKPAIPANAVSLPPSADFDVLEFSRAAEVNINATISLVRDETPERFRLSKELATILDVNEEARGGIVVGLWDYIKAMELQDNEDKRAIRCDDRLKALFNRDKVFFPTIPDSASAHTAPLEAIKLPYTIRVDQDFQTSASPTIYDIRIAVDDPLRAKLYALTTSPAYPTMLRQCASLDDQLALIVQATNHSKARHAFFNQLALDPARFVRRWNASQRRDLEVIMGEATRGGGGGIGAAGEDYGRPEFRRGGDQGAWDSVVAREAVRYMLAKPGGR